MRRAFFKPEEVGDHGTSHEVVCWLVVHASVTSLLVIATIVWFVQTLKSLLQHENDYRHLVLVAALLICVTARIWLVWPPGLTNQQQNIPLNSEFNYTGYELQFCGTMAAATSTICLTGKCISASGELLVRSGILNRRYPTILVTYLVLTALLCLMVWRLA